MVDMLTWSWETGRIQLIVGLFSGLVLGLIIGLFRELVLGLTTGLLFGTILGIASGLTIKQVEEIIYPGQRLMQTFRNAVSVSLTVGLGITISLGLNFGILAGGLSGLILGVVFGIRYGGKSLIQHYFLRAILARNGDLPLHLIPFLDFTTDLLFLRKIGGGYIFIHRFFMEEFASIET